jgi:drug/metabolite transporter (DMT)-like permease
MTDTLSADRKGPICMVAASIFWSFGGLCIKFIPWGAMSIISIRAIFAALVFIIFRRSVKIDFTFGNILTALCLSATTILFVFANKLTTAAAAVLLQFTAPVFIILFGLIFYKKKPTISSSIAVAVTLLGMLLFFADRLDSGHILGNILAIISGITFAGMFVCNKRPDTNPEHALLLGFIINSVIGAPFVFFEVTADVMAWGAAIFMGVVQVGLAYVFFSIGIKKTSALLACLITAMEPVLNPIWVFLAGIWGWLPEVEVPGQYALIGGVVIIVTIVGYNVWLEKHPDKTLTA